MRSALVLAGLLFATGTAFAVDLPIAGNYGTPGGCAVAGGQSAEAGAEVTVFLTAEARFNGNICPYTDVSEVAGQSAWNVRLRCPIGHEDEVSVALTLAEDTAAKTITVETTEGDGPEGEFAACATP